MTRKNRNTTFAARGEGGGDNALIFTLREGERGGLNDLRGCPHSSRRMGRNSGGGDYCTCQFIVSGESEISLNKQKGKSKLLEL